MIRRALVGCETSGNTRRALQARGIITFSCDILPSDDNSPWHMQMDVRKAVSHFGHGWFDFFLVHPTCTYLSVSGLHWNKRGRMVDGRPRAELTEEAVAFCIELMSVDIPHIIMENPIGCLSTRYRKPNQIVQPYQFGHDASKATCLWMKNVPNLAIDPELYVPPRLVCENGHSFPYGKHKCPECSSEKYLPRWGNQTDSGQNKLAPSDDRWKLRSETYQGISDAIADVAVSL